MRGLAAVAMGALVAACLAVPARAADEVDYFTYLQPAKHHSSARGNSEYEREGKRREVEVTVTGIPGLSGHRVAVYVNGHELGTMLVSSRGRAHREWSTAHGQSVPSAGAGSPVRVRTTGGTLIAFGIYQPDQSD